MSHRIEKVQELIHHEASRFLAEELSPEFGMFTITSVEVTPDLKLGKIWASYLGNEENPAEVLGKITPQVQHFLNRRLSLKFVPKISFEIDKSFKKAQEIEKVFKKIHEEEKE